MTMKVTQLSRSQSHFNPTNVELVDILRRKIDGKKASSFVIDTHHNLYEKEPWLLQHVSHVRFYENEWFYFVTRKKPPGAKKVDSKRPCRQVLGSGRWKMTGRLTQIKDKDGVKIGSVRNISFKAKTETEEITTGWVMHEFVLEKPGFQEVVLCRIRFNPRKDNAQYAPRLTPIMIGLGREDGSPLVENNIQTHMTSINHAVAASGGEETQYLDAPVETHQAQEMEQRNGSCSGEGREALLYSAPQHQQIMGKDSNYPMLSGGMEQHQDFGSYGQQQNHVLGHREQYGQGFGDMVEYQNQYLGQGTTRPVQVPMLMNQGLTQDQQWNEYFGPSSAHQFLGQNMVPMIHHQEQHSAAQHQHLSVNGSMEQHQGLGSSGQFFGESSRQQQNHILGPQETYHHQQYQNLSRGQERNFSYAAQTMEEQQQWNGHSAPYSAQPYDQGMMENQDSGSSALRLAQNPQYLGQNNDLSALGEHTAQQQHLGEDLNVSPIQQQNQILGQATHFPPMGQQFWQTDYQSQLCGQHTDPSQVPVMMNQALEEQHYVPWSAQPYDHHKGQNNAFPTVTEKTQQQQEDVIRNSPALLQLWEEENVPLMNQNMEEQAIDLPVNQGIGEPLEPYPEIDSEMANFGDEEWAQELGENTPVEEAELTAALANCKKPDSLLNFFCPSPTNVK